MESKTSSYGVLRTPILKSKFIGFYKKRSVYTRDVFQTIVWSSLVYLLFLGFLLLISLLIYLFQSHYLVVIVIFVYFRYKICQINSIFFYLLLPIYLFEFYSFIMFFYTQFCRIKGCGGAVVRGAKNKE